MFVTSNNRTLLSQSLGDRSLSAGCQLGPAPSGGSRGTLPAPSGSCWPPALLAFPGSQMRLSALCLLCVLFCLSEGWSHWGQGPPRSRMVPFSSLTLIAGAMTLFPKSHILRLGVDMTVGDTIQPLASALLGHHLLLPTTLVLFPQNTRQSLYIPCPLTHSAASLEAVPERLHYQVEGCCPWPCQPVSHSRLGFPLGRSHLSV